MRAWTNIEGPFSGTLRIINENADFVKWDIVYRTKSLGGLGILNTQVMNGCLIIKWWWRIMTATPGTLWFDILKARYS